MRESLKIKKFFKLFLTFGLALAAYITYCFYTTLAQSYPVSFQVKEVPEIEAKTLQEIEDAQILLVGDHYAQALEKYLRSIDGPIAKTSLKLRAPLKLAVLSTQNLSLARINFILKKLKKIPGLVIFHGNGSEYFEKKIDARDFSLFRHNVKLYQNPTIATLLMSLPDLGRFIYRPLHYQYMHKISAAAADELAPDQKMSFIELSNIIFNYELDSFAQILRKWNTDVITITTPVNIEKLPREACAQSVTSSIITFQNEQTAKINQQNYKEAYNSLQKLIEAAPGNAISYHLLGKASVGLGLFDEARDAFMKANAFDCSPAGSSTLINQAVRQWVLRNSFKIIDFDDDIARQIGRNDIFINDQYPQDYYYQQVLNSVTEAIMRHFRL